MTRNHQRSLLHARITVLFVVGLAACSSATSSATNVPAAAPVTSGMLPPALASITEDDLRRDLFALAGDAMRGREAGTLDELRASAWIAERARDAGLAPAGDDDTYFQWWSIRRTQTSPATRVIVDRDTLVNWREVAVMQPVDATLDLQLAWVGDATGTALSRIDVRGKAAVALLRAPARPPAAGISLREWRYARQALTERAAALANSGAAAIILVADDSSDGAFQALATGAQRGTYALDTAGLQTIPSRVPQLFAPKSMRTQLQRARRVTLRLRAESYTYPSVNVVARATGTDAALRNEHVLFSGHQDHDGTRYAVNGDSIWNGADDNATVAVAMLAIGRAWAKQPGKRSALFVWHGAEERGLLGSRLYAMRPTVPANSIVAVLNADMIGRNHPDSAALLGVQPPHRNSAALVELALEANKRVARFVVDSSWDAPTHPEGWYFRSDHLPYARAGFPAIMFSTLLHPDYHTPRDEPSRIDIGKLRKMTLWMYATGWMVSEGARVTVDEGFKLER